MNVLGTRAAEWSDESLSVSGLRIVESYCFPHAWIQSSG